MDEEFHKSLPFVSGKGDAIEMARQVERIRAVRNFTPPRTPYVRVAGSAAQIAHANASGLYPEQIGGFALEVATYRYRLGVDYSYTLWALAENSANKYPAHFWGDPKGVNVNSAQHPDSADFIRYIQADLDRLETQFWMPEGTVLAEWRSYLLDHPAAGEKPR